MTESNHPPVPLDGAASAVARAMTEASDGERIAFPAVLAALAEVGVERYHADLAAACKTYYAADGGAEAVPCHPLGAPPAAAFSAAGVEAAVRAVQAGAMGYRAFCAAIAAAGCVGYHVTLPGRRAVYYGRTGDSHTEWFPGAR